MKIFHSHSKHQHELTKDFFVQLVSRLGLALSPPNADSIYASWETLYFLTKACSDCWGQADTSAVTSTKLWKLCRYLTQPLLMFHTLTHNFTILLFFLHNLWNGNINTEKKSTILHIQKRIIKKWQSWGIRHIFVKKKH